MWSQVARLRDAADVRIWRVFGVRLMESRGVECGSNLRLYGWPIVHRHPGSKIVLGDGTVLTSDSRFTALGVAKPVVLRTLRPEAELLIGADTGISGGSICSAVSVRIGRRCLLGADVMIADTDFHSMNPVGRRFNSDFNDIGSAAVEIGDDVFIGARAVVLKGVSIGHGAVVGAAAVVTRSVAPGSIVAGNPARLVGRVAEHVERRAGLNHSAPTAAVDSGFPVTR